MSHSRTHYPNDELGSVNDAAVAAVVETFDVIVEVPLGEKVKYELEMEGCHAGRARVDRILSCAMSYPGNYGFVPGTLAEDGDATDVLIVNDLPIQTGAVLKCRAIGLLEMEDEKGRDDKLIAMPSSTVDPRYNAVRCTADLHDSVRAKIVHFFEQYKMIDAPARWSKVGACLGPEEAQEMLSRHRRAHRLDRNAEETGV